MAEHARRVLLLSIGALLTVSTVSAGVRPSDPPPEYAVVDLRMDSNGDHLPDRLGHLLSVRGRVTVLAPELVLDVPSVFVQDVTGGVMVAMSTDATIAIGDSVKVEGVLQQIGDDILLAATDVQRIDVDSSVPLARPVREGEVDLSSYYGARIELGGYIYRITEEESGISILLSRQGGPLLVRAPGKMGYGLFPSVDVGDYVRVSGALLAPQAEVWPVPRIVVGSPGDITPSFPIESYIRWGLLFGVAAAMVALYFLGSLILGRVRESRERPFGAIFEQGAGSMLLLDSGLKILDANKAACHLLHRSYAHVRLRKFEEVVRLEVDADLNDVASRLKKGEKQTIEAGVPISDGTVLDLDVTFSRIRTKTKQYVLAHLHDVSHHTDSVNQFRQFHEELLDGMPVDVSVLTPSGKYLYANGHGYGDANTREWLIGHTDLDLCRRLGQPSEVALRRRAHRRRAIVARKTVQFEEVLTERNKEKHLLRTYHPVFQSADGEVAAIASYGLDITELKNSRLQLDVARGEVDKVGRLKESLLENINHEFRTPITGIIGFAEILESEVPEEHREFVNLIERNGRRLMNTLNAVLDLAGLNNNDFNLSPQVLNLVDEVNTIVESSREMAEEKGLFLRVESSRPELLTRVDQVCLARVVQNLIDNSIKFTEAGGIIVEIDTDDDYVNFRVLDSGVGIEREFEPHIFDDFNRQSAVMDGSFDGVGIGLGITKRLVELMKGTIQVETQRNEGSVFSVSVPRAFPANGRFTPGKPKLLVVDDSTDVATMVQYVLEDYFEIEVANDLNTMEALVHRTDYDVVMMDLGIAKYSTVVESVVHIREHYDDKRIPLVAVDEKSIRGRDDQIREIGFDYYVAKPFKKLMLIGLLSEVIYENHYRGRSSLESTRREKPTTFLKAS